MTKKKARFLLALLGFKLPKHKGKCGNCCSCELYIHRELTKKSRDNNIEYCKLLIQSKYYNDLQTNWMDKIIAYDFLELYSENKEITNYIRYLNILNSLAFIVFIIMFTLSFLGIIGLLFK